MADPCRVRHCGSKGFRPASTSSLDIRCRSSWRSCRRCRQQSRSTSPSRRRSQSAARAMSRVQATQKRSICVGVEETSSSLLRGSDCVSPCEDLLHGNRLRNARCARKNCTPRVVLNTNFGRCRAGTRIFSETSAIGPMRAVRRERVLAPGEIANQRAARAKKISRQDAKNAKVRSLKCQNCSWRSWRLGERTFLPQSHRPSRDGFASSRFVNTVGAVASGEGGVKVSLSTCVSAARVARLPGRARRRSTAPSASVVLAAASSRSLPPSLPRRPGTAVSSLRSAAP